MKSILIAAALAMIVGCASTSSDSEPTVVVNPLEISSAQPSRVASIPIRVRVSVTNKTLAPMTVDRIDVSSVGQGPYEILSTAVDFHHAVQPGHVNTFPVWVQATVSQAETTIAGQESAMIMRAIVFYTTSAGSRRTAVVQKVETSISRRD